MSRYGWMRVTMCALKAVGVSVRLAPAQLGPALARSLLPGRKLQGRGHKGSGEPSAKSAEELWSKCLWMAATEMHLFVRLQWSWTSFLGSLTCLSQPLAPTVLLWVSMNLTALDISRII